MFWQLHFAIGLRRHLSTENRCYAQRLAAHRVGFTLIRDFFWLRGGCGSSLPAHDLRSNPAAGSSRSPAADLFPLITPDQLRSAAPDRVGLLKMEVIREAATLLMLAAVALVSTGVSGPGWLAAFAVAFGIWDLFYYVSLKMLIGWPTSLLTWDVLFLIPVPWAAPVLAPIIVSLSIIGTGLLALHRRVRLQSIHWSGLPLGAGVILLSFTWDFTWDFRNISGGGMPHAFPWPWFACGEVLGLGTFLHARRST
jgi:hypothetical protein